MNGGRCVTVTVGKRTTNGVVAKTNGKAPAHIDPAESSEDELRAQDLAFMRWVREATMNELAVQFHYAMSWQRVAIDREMQRRIKA
jgi:hypothetical protein